MWHMLVDRSSACVVNISFARGYVCVHILCANLWPAAAALVLACLNWTELQNWTGLPERENITCSHAFSPQCHHLSSRWKESDRHWALNVGGAASQHVMCTNPAA